MAASARAGLNGGKGKKGNYFKVSVGSAKEVARQTGSAEKVLAYFALCNLKQGESEVSTGGVPLISSVLGVSRHEATKYLNALRNVTLGAEPAKMVVMSPEEWAEVSGGEATKVAWKGEAKILPCLGEDDLYLDNSFITPSDGRSKPAAQRFMEMPRSQRLDALLLFMELYANHQLGQHNAFNGCLKPPLLAC